MSSKPWPPEQIDRLITNIRRDIEQFNSGGNTLDRENILDLICVHDVLRDENKRLVAITLEQYERSEKAEAEVERLRALVAKYRDVLSDEMASTTDILDADVRLDDL